MMRNPAKNFKFVQNVYYGQEKERLLISDFFLNYDKYTQDKF